MDDYPKTIELKDGKKVTLQVMTNDDLEAVIAFFQSLPEEDRLYLRSDTGNPENVRRRFGNLNYENMFPILVMFEGEIAGIATLFRAGFGWMRNLGEIRVVIAPSFQRKGLARILIRELFFQALNKNLYKLQLEFMDTQESARIAAEHMGFHKEAILRKHVTDINGIRRDLIIMTLDVEDMWYLMEDHVKTPDFRIH
jgi:RimJ/RimL family protein N-acetyltransferase